MSSIARESDDPEIAKKLLKVIDALLRGEDIERAAGEASLAPDVAHRFLESMKAHVGTLARSRAGSVSADGKRVEMLAAYTDGASRGNPGEAACAVILFDEKQEELLRRAKRLGVATNNVAEYEGVLLALELAAALGARTLRINLDSELVVRQLNREYKVKHPSLKPLFVRANELMKAFDRVEVSHVSREETRVVDKLANDELDGKT